MNWIVAFVTTTSTIPFHKVVGSAPSSCVRTPPPCSSCEKVVKSTTTIIPSNIKYSTTQTPLLHHQYNNGHLLTKPPSLPATNPTNQIRLPPLLGPPRKLFQSRRRSQPPCRTLSLLCSHGYRLLLFFIHAWISLLEWL